VAGTRPPPISEVEESRGAFGGFIGPRTLLAQVGNTASWIFDSPEAQESIPPGVRLHEMATGPFGWRRILGHADRLEATEEPEEGAWLDYFALCLAAHFGTAGTHVPTDVDTKIRGHLWFRLQSDEALDAAIALAQQLAIWDVRTVTARTLTYDDFGVISGHDGERLGVLGAGLLRFLKRGDEARATVLAEAIQHELEREVAIFEWLCRQRGREVELCRVAGNLTHNAGDLDQGFSCSEGKRLGDVYRERWGRLAHLDGTRFGGSFQRAAAINKAVVAPEAHRHYPLRKIAELREGPVGLRPPGPFFDDWGAALARHGGWKHAARGNVLAGLLHAERKVAGQRGYARALAGFHRVYPGGIDALMKQARIPTASQRVWKDPEVRRRVSVTQASFEAQMAKLARQALRGL
jgi:hypothetical protein